MTHAPSTDLQPFQAPMTNGNELAQSSAAASAQHEIQSAIIIARKFPRNEEACFQRLMKAAMRPSFAEDATYSFPRGGQDVTGPSVNLAREAARLWGNIRFGLYVVRDDEDTRLIRGFAYDVEHNVKVEVEDDFRKLIQRKVKEGPEKGKAVWVIPDERDLRELTNRRGAILLRNALLQVMPKDLIEDALYQCSKTLETEATSNPDGERKRLLLDFGSLNIAVEQIEQKLGHAFAQSTPKELAELRGICKSIQDGHTTWAEYVKGPEPKPVDDLNKEKLVEGQAALRQQQKRQNDAPPPTPDDHQGPTGPKTLAYYSSQLRCADSAKQYALIMNEALNGPDALVSPTERKTLTDLKNELMSGKKK